MMMTSALAGGLALPLRGWAFPYNFNGSFELYPTGSVNFHPTLDLRWQDADAQAARGISVLDWAFCWNYPSLRKADPRCTGTNCTVANKSEAVQIFANQADVNHSRPGMTPSVLGRGLDECNVDNSRFAEERELAAEGYRLARRRQPNNLVAAWGANAGDDIFASLMLDGTFDLAMIEGYTYCPGCDNWPAPGNGCCPVPPAIEDAVEAYAGRLDFARKSGYLNRTLFCFGFILGQSKVNPYGWTKASLKKAMTKLKARYPELAGVLMYGFPPRKGFANASSASTDETDRATTDLIKEANALMLQLWPPKESADAVHADDDVKDDPLAERPWMRTAAPPEARAKALLARMSAREKLVLLQGAPASCDGQLRPPDPWIAGCTAPIPRLGVRGFHLEDGPNGLADWMTAVTNFPSALTAVASWDIGLMRQYGAAMGAEQRGKGMHVMLGPGLNLARVPVNGRNFEYMGEDPHLAAWMAAAEVKGIQSQGVVACVKHWIDNNQEGPHHNGRLDTSSSVGERANHELYYAPFEAAIEAGAGSVMCSYNLINISGTPTYSCESHPSLTGVLKGELNFSGWVVSDWGADHGSVASLNAGMDQTMGGGFSNATAHAILGGAVPQSRIDDAALRVLTPLFRVGAFDRTDYGDVNASVMSPSHTALAQTLAEQSTVLLKSDGALLPLSASDPALTIAVVGDANNVRGGGSGAVWAHHIVSPAEGIRARVAREEEEESRPLKKKGPQVTNHSIYYNQSASCGGNGQCNQSGCTTLVSDADIAAAVGLASAAKVAIVTVAVTSTEGYDRFNLSLGPQQDKLVREVALANPNTIVVVRCPGAVLMPWLGLVKAVLVQFLPGQEAGHALASVVFGDVNPSGKLPLSFPQDDQQTWLAAGGASSYPGVQQPGSAEPRYIANYAEGLQMGYRWFDQQGRAPLFPFGAGLSYSTFALSELHIGSTSRGEGVSATLTNTGKLAGATVVQLYLGFPQAADEPPQQLKGFRKVHLEPGESTTVRFTPLRERDLSVWDVVSHAWREAKGTYRVSVGLSSRDPHALVGSFVST